MWAFTGMKFWPINSAVLSSSYDSASSRAQAPQAGAALKSNRMGLCFAWASASDRSTSLLHFTAIFISLEKPEPFKMSRVIGEPGE